jgi:hypothetical protein
MAHPPHAVAHAGAVTGSGTVAESDEELSFEPPHHDLNLAREVMREDGLNALEGLSARERHAWDAAWDENRSEEAAIFERAAARIRPAWTAPDELLDLGLANAVPAAPPVEPAAAVPSSFPALLASSTSSAAPVLDARESVASSHERTDGHRALAGLGRSFSRGSGLRQRTHTLRARPLLVAGAVAFVVLGSVWAAFSSQGAPKSAAQPSAMPALPAPAFITPPAQPAPAGSAELREPAPKTSKPPAKKAVARAAKRSAAAKSKSLVKAPPAKPLPLKKPHARPAR